MTGSKNHAPGESFAATPAAPENPDPPTHDAAVRDLAFAHLRKNILRIRIVSEKIWPDISFGCAPSTQNPLYWNPLKKLPPGSLKASWWTIMGMCCAL
jgi:hypothetical protein